MSSRPEPAFEAPWHAQVFALTVALNEAGHFSWTDWAETFGATLKRHGLNRSLDGWEDYFNAWLDALESMLRSHDLADETAIEQMRAAWESAYLSTPHGAPVKLPTI
ncbi:MAG: nitrile hydratase accessory protein [Shimia sp.]|jgi:nitrile hydratase accessory protein|uniref:nitrile hydratase accessory protein n=1 Tax=Shimia sp. TaxID=1954381 RepID=UPI0040583088